MVEGLNSYFERLRERQKAYRAKRRTVCKIVLFPNAMTLSWRTTENDRGELVLAWQDVNTIEAFKRDLYAVDLICLAIILKDHKIVEINEEMEGWDSLVEKLPDYLPGCRKFAEWFSVVAFPAFQPNVTEIYHRA